MLITADRGTMRKDRESQDKPKGVNATHKLRLLRPRAYRSLCGTIGISLWHGPPRPGNIRSRVATSVSASMVGFIWSHGDEQNIKQRAHSPAPAEHSPEKAVEVFATVELIEDILLRLNALDILRAMQVSRFMRDTVIGSSKLLKHIGLSPNLEAHFSSPLWPGSEKSRIIPRSLPVLSRHHS
ncbi:hypothetical protein CLAFUW4_07259 [Fulvia fulva]|uniref:F-box domain-containing protein n=1 Tax=Passalora fulva TaxID=5499 RepID=A0A9Q8UQH7_PASFU|nr:uncharacterized protein CLAFUR5_07390 [Fulvia fulva]KAK4621478.1 hypothetical protein CLAFUR4_07267 [Fulvia fulva]KAK4623253.1 hypothetical protein CLAFUR0_07265 [Fulvia fulva]UJO18773.1 hypothetical protein CLAFUR5_07390 [Fulvia fulva]WPV16677.1 hypothetical protein CLAFUW4_07259 [Fulvia fulva]WPV30982.1 hypothetical protein CLAFUW7_07261 [Fulvia fulva]